MQETLKGCRCVCSWNKVSKFRDFSVVCENHFTENVNAMQEKHNLFQHDSHRTLKFYNTRKYFIFYFIEPRTIFHYFFYYFQFVSLSCPVFAYNILLSIFFFYFEYFQSLKQMTFLSSKIIRFTKLNILFLKSANI